MIKIIKVTKENNKKKNDDLVYSEFYDFKPKFEILDITPLSCLYNLEKLSIFDCRVSIELIKQLIN